MKDLINTLCRVFMVLLLVTEIVGLGLIVGPEFRQGKGAVGQEEITPAPQPQEQVSASDIVVDVSGNVADVSSNVVEEEVPADDVYTVVVHRLYVFKGTTIADNVEDAAIAELKRGDDVTLLEEGENYTKISTADGKEGYVWNDCIQQKKTLTKETLVSKVIVLDAGHQEKGNNEKEPVGPGSKETKPKVSSGTAGVATKVNEHVLNLDIALQLEEELEERGYVVIQVRRTADINISNIERANLANMVEADAFIRLHADGSSDPNVNGCMTICSTKSSPYPVKEYYEQSYQLAETVLDEYTNVTGIKRNKILQSDTYSGINWCEVPVIIMEMGYMSNAEEDKKLCDKDFQIKIVEGLVNGLDKYFEVSYVE